MTGPNVRSVTVRLEADVAAYIAKMEAAGAATKAAFSDVDKSVGSTNRTLSTGRTDVDAYRRDLDKLSTSARRVSPSMTTLARDSDRLSNSVRKAGPEVDRLSGRLSILRDAALVLGPAMGPLSTVAVAGVAGLANQFGFAALAAGTAVAAFQGVGNALKAIDKAQLAPTTANLQAARLAMENLSPAARDMVAELDSLEPVLSRLKESTQAALFPSLIDGLEELRKIAPDVKAVMHSVADGLGEMFKAGAEDLASGRWDDFFHMLAAEARPTLSAMGHVLGSVAHGFAEIWTAFAPLNRDFSNWMVDAAAAFDEWATGLDQTQGFRDFVDYIRDNGPRVGDALMAVGDAVVQIAEAVAPLGGPSLTIITTFAKALASLADSDIGTPLFAAAAGFAALNRALAVTSALQTRLGITTTGATGAGLLGFSAAAVNRTSTGIRQLTGDIGKMSREYSRVGGVQSVMLSGLSNTTGAAQRTRATFGQLARTATTTGAAIGGMAALTSGLADEMNATNTATGAMIGSMGGPLGAVIGAAVGNLLDMKAAYDAVNDAIRTQDTRSAESLLHQKQDAADLGNAWNWLTGASQRAAAEEFYSVITTGQSQYNRLARQAATAGFAGNMSRDLKRAGISLDDARGSADHFSKSLLKVDRAAAHLKDIQTYAHDAAQGFYTMADAVEKPKLSLEDLETRMHRQAVATAQMAENMRKAIQNGVDPRALKQMFDELGTDGALALQQLANGGKKAAHQFNASFDETRGSAHSLEAVLERLTRAIDHLSGKAAKPKLDLDDAAFRRKAELGHHAIDNLGHARAVPKFDADISRFLNDKGKVDRGLEETDHKDAKPTISITDHATPFLQRIIGMIGSIHDKSVTITTFHRDVRAPGDTAGGPPAPDGTNAEGGTIPKDGKPYADRYHYLLAPGEEVISNRHGQADRWRPLLKAINAGRLAEGGTAGPRDWSPGFQAGEITTAGWVRAMNEAGSAIIDLATVAGHSSISLDDAFDRETKARKRHLEDLIHSYEKEQQAVQDRIAAVREEEQSIREGIGQIITGAADLLGTVRTPVIPGIGSTGEITWTDSPATFASFNQGVDTEISTGQRLVAVLKKLKKKGFSEEALSYLLAQGADIATLEDFANQTRASLAATESNFEYLQHLQNQVGGQAAGQLGLTAELRGLRKDNAELRAEMREAKHHLAQISKHSGDGVKEQQNTTAAVRHVGGDVAVAIDNKFTKARQGARNHG